MLIKQHMPKSKKVMVKIELPDIEMPDFTLNAKAHSHNHGDCRVTETCPE